MLPKSVIKDIRNEVDDVYDRIKARFLNEKYKKKGIEFTFRNDTLEDFFRDIAEREGVEPDKDTLATLKEVAGSYLDASRERAKAQVIQAVQAVIRESVLSGETPNVRVAIQGQMSKIWGDATTHVNTILESEVNTAKNVSILEGITKYNASVGVDDPVVFFIIVRDGVVCSECVRLHMMPDGVTPRLWYMSEVGSGYHKKGDPNPKLSGLHPSCRCQLSTLLLGYGFNASGKVTYVAKDHSEIDKQRGMTKSEGLAKSTRETLTSGLWDKIRRYSDENSRKTDVNTYDPDAQEYIREANIAVHTPLYALRDIIDSGRLKNQFETGTSKGALSPKLRSEVEEDAFDINRNHGGHLRPIYGALHVGGVQHSKWGRFHNWFTGPAQAYGNVWFELHPHVKERSTFCGGDSLNHYQTEECVAPEIYTHPQALQHLHMTDEHPYTEAHVHGGVYLDKDVKAIHVSRSCNTIPKPYDSGELKELGEKYNLPVYFHIHKTDRDGSKVYDRTIVIHQPTEQPLGKSTTKTLESGLWDRIKQHVESKYKEHIKSGVWENLDSLQQRLLSSPIAVNIPVTAVDGIGSDGRLKNQFETGTSRGVLGLGHRSMVEENLFGIPKDTEQEQRPVYGAVCARTQQETSNWHRGPASDYGDIWLELHPHVKDRTTFTNGDSFGATVAMPFDYLPRHGNRNTHYIEAQIHGGVYLDKDVKAVHATSNHMKPETKTTIMEKAKQLGQKFNLPVYFHHSGPFNFLSHTETLHDSSQKEVP